MFNLGIWSKEESLELLELLENKINNFKSLEKSIDEDASNINKYRSWIIFSPFYDSVLDWEMEKRDDWN